MSMMMLTVMQFLRAFFTYSFITVLLPSLLLRKRVGNLRLTERFFIYFTAGNFSIIFLVYILQFLRISYRWTLILATLIPFCIVFVKIRKIKVWVGIVKQYEMFVRIIGGELGSKTLLLRIYRFIVKRLHTFFKWFRENLLATPLDLLLTLAMVGLVVWQYGTHLITLYGYCFSDEVVHNAWVNSLGMNKMFASGIYPFGMHNIIYYLHTVFGIETYVLFRVFSLVQTLYIHLILLGFLKLFCKSGFAPYIGVGIYSVAGFFEIDVVERFVGALPQEFGMLFILPSIYFLFSFLRFKREEVRKGKFGKVFHLEGFTSMWYLIGFSMGICMTFTVHFYNSLVVGAFCLAMAIGFSYLVFRRACFMRVIAAGVIGLLLGALPMAVGVARGIELHGSFAWGMSIMEMEEREEAPQEEQEVPRPQTQPSLEDVSEETLPREEEEESALPEELSLRDEVRERIWQYQLRLSWETLRIGNRIWDYALNFKEAADAMIGWYILTDTPYPILEFFYIGMCMILVCGLISLLMKRVEYGAMLISVGFFMIIMTIIAASEAAQIVVLMPIFRSCVYYGYMLPLVWAFSIDAVLYLFFGAMKKKWYLNIFSLLGLAAAAWFMINVQLIREPIIGNPLQTNGAVVSLSNIIRENDNYRWTIVSANEENQMGWDYGRHMEAIEFLRKMEYQGNFAEIYIPTSVVYFFIEKVPIIYDYTVEYEHVGRRVSEEGAMRPLPLISSVDTYTLENRWIIMSRLYYWALKFREKYPNEFRVYYETDDFICYYIEQNEFRLLNFAIDYYYNMGLVTATEGGHP